eukprot:scaffold17909_cov61-Phaeocystis_antarctica.AAC.5
MRRRGRARELRHKRAPCVQGRVRRRCKAGTAACGGAGARLLHARHVEQLAKDEDARVLERLPDEARARSALCRLRQQAELLQRRTVLSGGGHAATCASRIAAGVKGLASACRPRTTTRASTEVAHAKLRGVSSSRALPGRVWLTSIGRVAGGAL